MKVLHICMSDTGGAGLCCIRIHQELLKNGVDSKVVVLKKTTNTPFLYQYGSCRDKLYRLFSKLIRFCGLKITDLNKCLFLSRQNKTIYTLPVSYVNLINCKWTDWADVIHLHWVSNYVDMPSFFKYIKRPVIWTLHDEYLFYGIAHHHNNILQNNPLEKKYILVKKRALEDARNLTIVFLSEMMMEMFGNKTIIKDKKKTIINNFVDTSIFTPHNKKEMRVKYHIDNHKIVFLFVATRIDDPNKGLDVLSQALSEINNEDFLIIAVGGNPLNKSWPLTLSYGLIDNTEKMCELLSIGDYFAMPSFQEAFPQSPMEALACGLPVIAFPVSGTKELIRDYNGVVCDNYTKNSFKNGIEKMLKTKYDSIYIRKDVMKRFSPSLICNNYISLYDSVIKNTD